MLSRTLPIVFDTQTLSLFSQRLRNCPTFKFSYKKDCRDAAVLMPLCIVDNKPSVLFTVRNLNLRTHRGEISFPGGKADASDPSLEHTALRETFEEVGIAPDSIDILGRYSSVPNKTGSLCVHPFVGFIRDPIDPDALKFNPDEVSTVFTLSLDYLLRDDVRQMQAFRGSKHKYTVYKMPDGFEGDREIWGLTSFIVDGVFRKIMPEHYR